MLTMNDPRICIVGAGRLSTMRIYPYIGAAGAELVGVCDLDREKAETNARRFGGRVYTDYEEMLDSERPDGVIICIDVEHHASMAPVVMRRGIPVYVEKPPAPSAAAALEMARVSLETGVLCTTAFKKRYCTAYTRAKEWIDSFAPEDLFSIMISRGSGSYKNDSLRHLFILDSGIHHIDLIGYLFGDVEKVFAFSKGQNAYAISLKFANGAVGSLSFNDGRSFFIPSEEVDISARGGNGMFIHNSSVWQIVENQKCTEWREPPTFMSSGDSGNDTGHLAEIVDFLAAIQEGRTTRSNIFESYKTMVLYEAIVKSAETGKAVEVKYEPISR